MASLFFWTHYTKIIKRRQLKKGGQTHGILAKAGRVYGEDIDYNRYCGFHRY
jgi:hypothetical protein